MGLLSAYSNTQSLTPIVEVTAVYSRRDAERPSPQPPRRLSEAEKHRIIERYAAGASTSAIATELHIGKSTVNRVLKLSGVQLRPRGRLA